MRDAQQLSLAIDKPHRNQYLFSDHYLEEILRREKAWTAAQPAAAEFLSFLRNLHAAEGAQLADYNEAQLEENWIKPILSHLGHVWEPQASVPGMDKSIKKPDYVFFPDDETRKAAVADQRTEEYARRALAVGEVKAWPVNLSRKTAGAPTFDNNNPMFQIDYYLKATGVAWGIASNGRFWRLVHKDSSYRLDSYFEIDLPGALSTADERRALAVATYFTLFFGRAAFARDESGRVFLDDVLKGSRTYAVALESDLRDNAYKALEQIILGFFAPAANGLDPNDEGDRAAVYRNSLLLLYRLLFLFYGESRGLLPMANDEYHKRSVTALADSMARDVEDNRAHPPMTREYWGRLNELFRIINGSDADLNKWLNVPRYNGGLFNPDYHPFLEDHFVGDAFLVRAIDYLARRRVTKNGQYAGRERVDYRTLGVRQLGSIYEGLLEYKVSVAAEAMVTVRKGGKETWLPARERGKTKVIETKQPGELYLATDKGERKATGSYYTPDYIVKYIVEQTLGPLVEEAKKIANDEVQMTNEERARRFEEAILSLNVLDPAMGSGHFLVDATNYLARALATSDLTGRRSDLGQTETSPPDLSGLAASEESDLTYWKRRVVEACIYGVDKNELAVELAKLSLWLETVAADKPLSFLDHHLRHGDSLIGARLSDLERAPGAARPDRSAAKRSTGKSPQRRPVRSPEAQAEPLFDESAFTTSAGLAVGGAARIEAILTDDLDAVHDKERILREIQEAHLARWRRLADLWVSAWFGNEMSAEEYRDLALRLQGKPGGLMSDEQAARYLNHPAVVANDYFHWELAFPEVFFDEFGRPKGEKAGFDAVVGNPPYDVLEKAIGEDRTFELDKSVGFISMMKRYEPAIGGKFNIFRFFVALWVFLLNSKGQYGLIIPLSIATDLGCKGLRKFLLEETNLRVMNAFPDRYGSNDRVFSEAKTSVAILVGDKQTPKRAPVQIKVHPGGNLQVTRSECFAGIEQIKSIDPAGMSLPLTSNSLWVILERIHMNSKYLHQVATAGGGEIHLTYYKPYFRSNAKYREILRGAEIGRYQIYQEMSQGEKLYVDLHSAIEGGLNPTLFNESRIALQRLTGTEDRYRFLATVIPAGIHLAHTVQYISNKDESLLSVNFLLALICSKLLDARFRVTSGTTNIGVYELDQLPIPEICFSTDSFDRKTIVDSMITLSNGDFSNNLLKAIDIEVGKNRTDTIHDLLAYLAEQMIAMHKEKQSLTADFWTDLEGATDPAAFRKLRDKGKQEAGLAADAALAPFVRAESKSARTLDDSLAWDEAAFKAFVRALAGPVDGLSRLVKVYNDHAPRYRELVERIGRTDWLIDQIVYKLYGLTEEEIAIVEAQT